MKFPTGYSEYALSSDFDYRAFLEQRSHFDHLALAVDKSILSATASLEQLQSNNISVLSEIAGSMESGFSLIADKLDSLGDEIGNLSRIVKTGLYESNKLLHSISETLEALLHAAKNPEQTWAIEQFSVASDLFARGLYAEALEYVRNAIDGRLDKQGYKFESRFHFLSGMIRLGNEKNYSQEVVSLPLALEDFKSAAKYVDFRADGEISTYLRFAGFTAALLGQYDAAEHFLRESVAKREGNALANYDLARLLLLRSRKDEAQEYLARAFWYDIVLPLRAAADAAFLEERHVLDSALAKAKSNSKRLSEKRLKYMEYIASISKIVDDNKKLSESIPYGVYFRHVPEWALLTVSEKARESLSVCKGIDTSTYLGTAEVCGFGKRLFFAVEDLKGSILEQLSSLEVGYDIARQKIQGDIGSMPESSSDDLFSGMGMKHILAVGAVTVVSTVIFSAGGVLAAVPAFFVAKFVGQSEMKAAHSAALRELDGRIGSARERVRQVSEAISSGDYYPDGTYSRFQ